MAGSDALWRRKILMIEAKAFPAVPSCSDSHCQRQICRCGEAGGGAVSGSVAGSGNPSLSEMGSWRGWQLSEEEMDEEQSPIIRAEQGQHALHEFQSHPPTQA